MSQQQPTGPQGNDWNHSRGGWTNWTQGWNQDWYGSQGWGQGWIGYTQPAAADQLAEPIQTTVAEPIQTAVAEPIQTTVEPVVATWPTYAEHSRGTSQPIQDAVAEPITPAIQPAVAEPMIPATAAPIFDLEYFRNWQQPWTARCSQHIIALKWFRECGERQGVGQRVFDNHFTEQVGHCIHEKNQWVSVSPPIDPLMCHGVGRK